MTKNPQKGRQKCTEKKSKKCAKLRIFGILKKNCETHSPPSGGRGEVGRPLPMMALCKEDISSSKENPCKAGCGGGEGAPAWIGCPKPPPPCGFWASPPDIPRCGANPKGHFFFRHCTTNSWQVVSQTSPKSPCPHIRPPLREPKCGGGVLSGAKGCLGTGDTMMCHDAFFSGGGELSACFEEMLLVKSKCLRVKQWTQETFTFFGAKFRILFPVGSPLCKHNPLVYW